MTFATHRDKYSGFTGKVGGAFAKLRLSPNQWTIVSLIPAIVAVYYMINNMFLVAALLFIFSCFLDIVDGAVARHTGRASIKGGYVDTIVDRYVEFIIIFGIMMAGIPDFIFPSIAWIFIALFGSFMNTYTKAAAKEKEIVKPGSELKFRITARAERLLILFAGIVAASINTVFLTYAIVFLAIITHISAVHAVRMVLRYE